MTEPGMGDQASNEATAMTKFAVKALGRWTGNLLAVWKIQYAVTHRRVLGADSDLKRMQCLRF